MLGSELGNEQKVAAQEAQRIGATVVLGDRRYSCTMWRIYDRLKFFVAIKVMSMLIW